MKIIALLSLGVGLLSASAGHAANPYLNAPDGKPHSAVFRGTEWGDEVGPKRLPLSAKVVTTRVAKMEWGEVYKIAFENIVSKAPTPRAIKPEYYVVTDKGILLLNEEDMDKAVKDLAEKKTAPEHQQEDVRALSTGELKFTSGSWSTEITVKGDLCTYHSGHNSSGHYATLVWKKGVGLMEYASNYGAEADGYRLKRDETKHVK